MATTADLRIRNGRLTELEHLRDSLQGELEGAKTEVAASKSKVSSTTCTIQLQLVVDANTGQKQSVELEVALAAATAAVAGLESEKSALSQDEKALGERISALETTIRDLESGKADTERILAEVKESSAKTIDEVSVIQHSPIKLCEIADLCNCHNSSGIPRRNRYVLNVQRWQGALPANGLSLGREFPGRAVHISGVTSGTPVPESRSRTQAG